MRKLYYEEGKEEMLTAKRCVVTVYCFMCNLRVP